MICGKLNYDIRSILGYLPLLTMSKDVSENDINRLLMF